MGGWWTQIKQLTRRALLRGPFISKGGEGLRAQPQIAKIAHLIKEAKMYGPFLRNLSADVSQEDGYKL